MKHIKLFEKFNMDITWSGYPNIFQDKITIYYLNTVLESYLESTLWIYDHEEFGDGEEENIDSYSYTIYDIDQNSLNKTRDDIEKLMDLLTLSDIQFDLTNIPPSTLGHIFCLSRNGYEGLDINDGDNLTNEIINIIDDIINTNFNQVNVFYEKEKFSID